MKVLVTGASGFVGRFLCRRLLDEGWSVRGTLLPGEAPTGLLEGVEPAVVEPFGSGAPLGAALAGVDVVIHLAARVHQMHDAAADPLSEFRRVNTEGTRQLALEAAGSVKRLVFVSSIKVNGEEAVLPYTAGSPERPLDPYGISKWEAEQALRRVEADTGLEVVVVRPTLVYGPGVRANFFNMMKVVSQGIPLPFGSIANRRSMVYVGNLADLLALVARHPAAGGKTFLASDGEDVSTPELIRRTAAALGVPARLLPFPVSLFRLAGRLTGKSGAVQRLTGSLAVESPNLQSVLGWRPPFSMAQGLKETAADFRRRTSA